MSKLQTALQFARYYYKLGVINYDEAMQLLKDVYKLRQFRPVGYFSSVSMVRDRESCQFMYFTISKARSHYYALIGRIERVLAKTYTIS